MFKEIINIFTPKGDLAGIPFIVNFIILRLIGLILNYIGLYISFNQLTDIPAIKFLSILILIGTLLVMLSIVFNYKRRLLQITQNLVLSIILAVLLSAVLDIILLIFYFKPFLIIVENILIPIVLAVLPAKNCNKKEYWATFLTRFKNFLKNPITVFIILMILADFCLLKISKYRNIKISQKTPTEQMEKLIVNPLSSYTGKTKAEILNIRKQFVKTSIFKTENYEPNEKVFGQIADKKPWWGADYILCSDKNIPINNIKNGNSEESRYINNPNLLIGITMSKSYVKNKELKDFCEDKSLLFIPKNIHYDKSNKLIIVTYPNSKHYTTRINKRFVEFLLVGLNARDFGYEWIYVNNSNNIRFLDPLMVNQRAKQLRDFIQVGNACRIEGGCNNASPYQPALTFSFKNTPASMTISLWKNKPLFKNQPADIYLKMIFE